MGAVRTRSIWLGLAAFCALGLLAHLLSLPATERADGPAESGPRARAQQLDPQSVSPLAPVVQVEGPAAQSQVARQELARDPSTIGPRKTHAKVELVCGVAGTSFEASKLRVQVLADSAAVEVDDKATHAVFAVRNSAGAWVADVTPLVVGFAVPPRRLRVVAESERCNAFADVEISLTPAELAAPSSILLPASLRFDCPWRVRGRIVAPCPPREVRIVVGPASEPRGAWRAASDTELSIEEDGRFEWRTDRDGAQCLEFHAPNTLPLGREFQIAGAGDVDLGDVVLEAGAFLGGQLTAAGAPLSFTDVAIARADERFDALSEVSLANLGRSGWVSDHDVLPHALKELGLLATLSGRQATRERPAALLVVSTDARGRFETSALRPGDHWLIPFSSSGGFVWLEPLRASAPSHGIVLEFDARAVRFEFLDAHGAVLRARVPCAFRAQLPGGEEVPLGIDAAPYGELHALVRPGALLRLRACDQELLVPVGSSGPPLVQPVSPCTAEPTVRK